MHERAYQRMLFYICAAVEIHHYVACVACLCVMHTQLQVQSDESTVILSVHTLTQQQMACDCIAYITYFTNNIDTQCGVVLHYIKKRRRRQRLREEEKKKQPKQISQRVDEKNYL